MPVDRTLLLLLGLAVATSHGPRPASAGTTARGPSPPVPVGLEPDSTGRYRAPVVEVRARRITRAERLDRAPGFATVLDAASWTAGASSASEFLARAVGLSVRETGGIGAYSTLSLRGSSASQVPVYLDGVLLNPPDRGAADLGAIDPTDLERVEIYRGTAPLVLGGASLGGAVHLFSGRSNRTRGSFSAASYGSYAFDLRGGRSGRRTRLRWHLRALRSAGDWEYLDDRGTLYNPHDDRRVRRTNNDLRGRALDLEVDRSLGSGRLRWKFLSDWRERGLPGLATVVSDDARSASLTGQSRVEWTRDRTRPGRFRSAGFHLHLDEQSTTDLDGDLGGGPSDRRDRVFSVGADIGGALGPLRPRSWRLETRWARLRSHDGAQQQAEGAPQTRWTSAVALQPSGRVLGGRAQWSLGARLEWTHERRHSVTTGAGLPTGTARTQDRLSPTLQGGLRWSIADELHLKVDLGVYERMPTLLELFGDRGTVLGNAELRPERGTNRDLGLVWARPEQGRRLSVAVFDNDAFDLIAFVPINPAAARAFNLGRASIRGLEVAVDFGRFGPWSLRANFTRLLTEDLSERSYARGAPLPGRPGYEFYLEQGLHTGRLAHALRLTALGQDYLETGARSRIPSRALWGWQTALPLHERWALVVRADNLGNAEVFDLWGHPLPGRRLQITLEYGGPRAR